MESFEHGFNLPPEWYHDPQTKCYTNFDTGDTFCYSEELFCFVDPPSNPIQFKDVGHINVEMGNKSSEAEEPATETPAIEAAPKKEDLPLRLYFGNGPRIHRRMSIAYGVINKRCDDCGEVGKLTCFSSSFRKWALRRVTQEEFNQTCSRCHLRGHTCVDCDIPFKYKVGLPVQKKKTQYCGRCGEQGHNRRSCFKEV